MASERDLARNKAARLLKRHGSASSLMSGSEMGGRYKPPGSIMSTISYMDEPRESRIEPPVSFEPTYQLGPEKHFPVSAVKGVLQDVMERHLENRQYEPEFCKETTKNMSEDIKSRVKLLKLGRFKIICLVHIGQLRDQGIHVSSRMKEMEDLNDAHARKRKEMQLCEKEILAFVFDVTFTQLITQVMS